MGNVEAIGILYKTRKGVNVYWILEESISENGVEKGKRVPNSEKTPIGTGESPK